MQGVYKRTEWHRKINSDSHKGIKSPAVSIANKKRIGSNHPMFGRKFSIQWKERLSESHLGKIPWNKGIKLPGISGELHPRWKGGYENKLMHIKKRRVTKLGAKGDHTLRQWEELKKKCDYTCLCCGKKEPRIRLSEDHIVPLSLGGSDDIGNIQPLCRSCNSRKQTKIIDYKKITSLILLP